MPFQLLNNNARSTLSVAVTSTSQATLTLQSGDGAKFPPTANPNYYRVTLDDGTNVEICIVVAISGDALTVLRGQEGTTAQGSFATGTKVELRLTEETLLGQTIKPRHSLNYVRPNSNVTSWHVLGSTLPTVVNSQIAGALTNSSWREQNARIRHACANSAQNPIEFRVAQPCVNVANGFRAVVRFGFALVPNSSHFFIGWINTTGAVASVHPPTSMTNMIGLGWANAGSLQGTFLSLFWNASGVATYLSLGSYYNVNTQAWYEFEVRADQPNTARLDWFVRRLDVSSVADVSSYLVANIPGNSLWLSPMLHGATMVTSGIGVELGGFAWET
jgi:hypothetical protein